MYSVPKRHGWICLTQVVVIIFIINMILFKRLYCRTY